MRAKVIITPKREVLDPQGKTVQSALEHMGYLEVGPETRQQLLDYAESEGNLDWNDAKSDTRVGEMLALVGATTEYQFG